MTTKKPDQNLITFTPGRLHPALKFIEHYWDRLERFRPRDDGTLLGLPSPYFVPSAASGTGQAYEEIFYWDTFFIAQGFIGTDRQYLIRGLVEDLLALMNRFRMIPNAGRISHMSRSQPPFLTTFILQVYGLEKSKRWLRESMELAKEEYNTVWMGTEQPNYRQVFEGLSRYFDINFLNDLAECESGWDYTTRFDRQCLSYIPVDLNALLYKYEKDFERVALAFGKKSEAEEWGKKAAHRKAMMRKYLWDEEKGFYFDYNFVTGKKSPVWSLAGFYPMWAGMDEPKIAKRIMSNLDKFEFDGGLATTAKEPEIKMMIPTQWAYPNGWAPLQFICCEAMEQAGYHDDAERIARKWLNANVARFEEKGEFFEKYNVVNIQDEPVEGVYPSQTGFGWTNGIFARFAYDYLRPEELPKVAGVRRRRRTVLKKALRDPKTELRRVGVIVNRRFTLPGPG